MTGDVPFTWEVIEDQLREALLAQASVLYEFGPSEGLAAGYLGIDLEDDPAELTAEQIAMIDLDRHALSHHARIAYDYTYGPDGNIDAVSEWHAADGILQSFPETDANGEPSPFCTLNDFPLRRLFETFFARHALFEENWDMTVRQLALLANMTVPAVRNALSKEGLKLVKTKGAMSRSRLDDASFKLPATDAKEWLSRRRGFIQRARETCFDPAELFRDDGIDFPTALSRAIKAVGQKPREIADRANVDPDWVLGLLDGSRKIPDVESLRRLASALGTPAPRFAAKAVEYTLST